MPMAATDKPKPAEDVPPDLLPLIRRAGVMTDRQYSELKARVRAGGLPMESRALARRLVEERLLTEYQVGRLLANKTNGLIVGRYVIQDKLGSGSMGRVYKAHHPLMDRVVALKIIAPEISQNSRVVARFQREIKLVGRLDHPNVVRAFDADQAGTMLYIVMEYVAGQSLGQLLRTRGIMAPADVAEYGAQAALGLGHAHSQGIVHRDVKPSNLFLSQEGQVKILDLGLGTLMEADEGATFATADGIAVGTIDYMSPEQACGRDVDGRSDLFSLGCAMYHLVTGKMPFPGDSPIDRLGKRMTGRPVPPTTIRPDLPSGLVRILDKLMANRPSDRFQTAEEAAEALAELLHKPSSQSSLRVSPSQSSIRASPSQSSVRPGPSLGPTLPDVPRPAVVEVEVEVEPVYPAWFRPLARLAEHTPAGALASFLTVLISVFGAGFALGWLLH